MVDAVGELRALHSIPAARGMKILAVDPVLLSYEFPPGHAPVWSGGRLPGTTVCLARVTTTDGLFGIGETYAGAFVPEVAAEIIKFFAPYAIGEDPSDVRLIWEKCVRAIAYWGRSGIAVAVLSALDAALWDLCGKALRKPVHELLGGACHPRLPRYASGGTVDDHAQLRVEMAEARKAGYVAAKIRTGTGPAEDRASALAGLAGLGAGGLLAVDAVQGSNPNPWTAEEAIAVGRELEDLDLLWFEEPCAVPDVAGYAACRRALDIPIAGGESCTLLREFEAFFDADALDIVQPDASHGGGVLEMRRVAAAAEEREISMAVHAWGAGPCVMANYHVAFASPNAAWLEFPTNANPLVDALMAEPLVVSDGFVSKPSAPGLGVTLSPEIEAAYPYRPGLRYHFEDRRAQQQETHGER